MKVSRLFAFAVVAAFSATLVAQQGGRIGPSGGEVAGAAVGVVAVVSVVVAVAVSHHHHVKSGCVVAGPHGLELQTSDSKSYALEGDAANLKVGDRVKIHGSKVKKSKSATGPDVFKVKMLDKDYGTCHVERASAASAAQ
ncbi:MAG: DUF5818 domain-containing protein [Acidobacteriaceae bacterium]